MTSRKDFAFKETSFFGWESEPAEESPSQFAASTFATLTTPRRQPPARRFNVVLVASVAVLGLGSVLLFGLVHLLRA